MTYSQPVHLTPEGLAEREGVPLKTIYSWRHKGYGPPSFRVGRHVRYRIADVERWEEQQVSRNQVPA